MGEGGDASFLFHFKKKFPVFNYEIFPKETRIKREFPRRTTCGKEECVGTLFEGNRLVERESLRSNYKETSIQRVRFPKET